MRLGVLMLPTDPWPETRSRAQRLETLGYDHLWTYDHLSWRRYRERPWFGAMPWLTGIAAATQRVRLGTMVASPNFRHPLMLAKEAMTLDHVSDGRTVLGGPQPTPAQRAERLAEFVEVVDRLLREPRVSHRGEHYTIDDARMIPGCVQQPRLPLAIAAAGPKTLALTARYADAWITNEADVRDHLARLEDSCAAIGRDPATIDRIHMVDNTHERPLASVEAFRDFSGRLDALGFTDIVFHHPRPDDPVWTEPEEIVEEIADAR